MYKSISNALLNVQKSKIVPLFLENNLSPNWMNATSCRIAQEGEVTEYLGCPIGYKVRPPHKANFILGKVRKRLCMSLDASLYVTGSREDV